MGKYGKTAQLNVNTRFAKFLLTIPFKAVTRVQIPLGTPPSLASLLRFEIKGVALAA
jgi:hypothetical protein